MEYLSEFYLGGSFSFSSSESTSEGEQEYLQVTKCLVTNCRFLLCYSIIIHIIQYNAYLDGNHAWLFGLNLSVFLKSGVSINWWWTLTPIPGAIPMDYSYGSS